MCGNHSCTKIKFRKVLTSICYLCLHLLLLYVTYLNINEIISKIVIQIAIIFRIIYIFETYPALYRKLKVCKLINIILYNCHNLFKYCNYYNQKGTNIVRTTCTNKYFFSKYNFLYKTLIKIY